MNFKLAALLVLASYAVATPSPKGLFGLFGGKGKGKGQVAATGGSAPTPITQEQLQMLTRNVYFAGAASCDNLQNWDCTACKEAPVKSTGQATNFNFKVSATHGYVAVNQQLKEIVIAFRGSQDIFAFIKDANVNLVDYGVDSNGAKVSQGFYNVWNPSRQQVKSQVSTLLSQNPGYTINVTGHSLGAAVASMTALELAIDNPNAQVTLIGVSQPRVGDQNFALAIAQQPNLTAYRLEQANDFVGQYPLPNKGYVHNSPEYWINPAFSESVVYCPSPAGTESQMCSNSVQRKLSGPVHNKVLGYNFAGGCGAPGQ